MDNENLNTALNDLIDAIRGVTLGSIETEVIDAAGKELIQNWNDHNPDDHINEFDELNNWEIQRISNFDECYRDENH